MVEAIDLVQKCVNVLQRHILPDSKLTDSEALLEIYEILDNKPVFRLLNTGFLSVKGNAEYESRIEKRA